MRKGRKMAYKDKALQRETTRERVRRYRAKRALQLIIIASDIMKALPISQNSNPKPVRLTPSPLPNCLDGRYRPTDADGNPIYDY